MASSKVYWTFWGACFATLITWIFAVAAAADDAWLSYNEVSGLELGGSCPFGSDVCGRYEAATAFQFMATVMISIVLVLVLVAAFTSPPTTGLLGLIVGIMLAWFSVFQMIAFALMAAMVDKLNDSYLTDDFEAGPTLGVAIISWLLGLVGTIIILALRSSATNNDEGPFRKCMSGGGGMAGGAKAGQNDGTV